LGSKGKRGGNGEQRNLRRAGNVVHKTVRSLNGAFVGEKKMEAGWPPKKPWLPPSQCWSKEKKANGRTTRLKNP